MAGKASMALLATFLVAAATALQMLVDWLQEPKQGKSTIVVVGILAAGGLTFLALMLTLAASRRRLPWP